MKGKRRIVGLMLAGLGALIAGPQHAIATPSSDTHAMVFNGTTTIFAQCEYEWASPIERETANIPRPRMYSDGPHCRDGSPNPGVQPIPCSLARNTGIYPAPGTPGERDITKRDPAKGETGLYPPCMGKLTASDNPGEQGCEDVGTNSSGPVRGSCNISTPGWFYGYCGQTFGGGEGGTLTTADGKVWRIDRFGFARGPGTWEVSGKLSLASNPSTTSTYRNTVNAAPNKIPDQAVACEVGQGLTSIIFGGALVMPAPPVKIVRPKAGWHWCADDPTIGGGSEGC